MSSVCVSPGENCSPIKILKLFSLSATYVREVKSIDQIYEGLVFYVFVVCNHTFVLVTKFSSIN